MEVFEINGPRKVDLREEESDLFSAMNVGKKMSHTRFKEIAMLLQLSLDQDHNQNILKFLEGINSQLQTCLTPGLYITFDKPMIKLFQHNLKGKIKIIGKSRPIGYEIKNLLDAATNIVLSMELY